MTSVYSGGLVYEYTEEVNKFGLVKVQGNDVKELPDFAAFKSALAKTPAPSDDGGYKLDGKPSDCPAKSEIWLVRNNSIPIMPSEAEKYFKNGAGPGVGIKTGDKGSQWAGKPSSGWTDSKDVVDPPNNKAKSTGVKNSPMFAFLGLSITIVFTGLVVI